MDITKDRWYDPATHSVPCRWIYNVRGCRGEEVLVPIYYITLVSGVFGLLFSIYTARCMDGSREHPWKVWQWNSARIYIAQFPIIQLTVLVDAAIKLINPHTSYGIRAFLVSSGCITTFIFADMYCTKMISTSAVVSNEPQGSARLRNYARILIHLCIPLSLICSIFMSLSGIAVDQGWGRWDVILLDISCGALILVMLIGSWVYCHYGLTLCAYLSEQLDLVDVPPPTDFSAPPSSTVTHLAARASIRRMRMVCIICTGLFISYAAVTLLLAVTQEVMVENITWQALLLFNARTNLSVASNLTCAFFHYYERKISHTHVRAAMHAQEPRVKDGVITVHATENRSSYFILSEINTKDSTPVTPYAPSLLERSGSS